MSSSLRIRVVILAPWCCDIVVGQRRQSRAFRCLDRRREWWGRAARVPTVLLVARQCCSGTHLANTVGPINVSATISATTSPMPTSWACATIAWGASTKRWLS